MLAINKSKLLLIMAYLMACASAALINPGATNPLVRNVGGCPLCDSSVYSYCDYKLTHDACCCTGPYAGVGGIGGLGGFGGPLGGSPLGGGPLGGGPIGGSPFGLGLPFQCQYNDCSFLYANTCIEMSLIRDCCCNSPYR